MSREDPNGSSASVSGPFASDISDPVERILDVGMQRLTLEVMKNDPTASAALFAFNSPHHLGTMNGLLEERAHLRQQEEEGAKREKWKKFPLGTDGCHIAAKEDYKYHSKAIVDRPANCPVPQFMNKRQIASCVDGNCQFVPDTKKPNSSDGRKDENGTKIKDVRCYFKCKGHRDCKALLRQSRPEEGQGDAYIVLQTLGFHIPECKCYRADTNGETVFRDTDTCYALPKFG